MTSDPLVKYAELARRHATPNDGTRAWVRRVNRAADGMRSIAVQQLTGPACDPTRFAGLLDAEDECIKLWAAHHLLELSPSLAPPIAAKALAVIEHGAAGDSVEALGERMWLRDWHHRNAPH